MKAGQETKHSKLYELAVRDVRVDAIFNLIDCEADSKMSSSRDAQQKWPQRLVFIGDKLNLASTLTESPIY